MPYNFLRDARSISNSYLCRYDSLNGYASDFRENGDFDGWTTYFNTYLYGSWNGVLFGTAFDRVPYIGRPDPFSSISAENYYHVRIMMKITNNNTHKVVGGLTKGKLRWVTIDDGIWDSNKELEFDIFSDDRWRLYDIDLGPSSKWVGYVNNLRVYPFIDGWSGDQFAIKFIKISSVATWTCANTQCSYYTQYQHNCPGTGKRGSCEAGVSKITYTTISGINDRLIVSIDDYGDNVFELGTNENVSGIEMSKIISNKLGSLNLGGYSYVTVEYSENDKIKIISGTTGSYSNVVVSDSPAAEELGFFSGGADISLKESGIEPATGFDYASSRLLTSYEINKLIDGDSENFAYIHNPKQYNVEGGRRDFDQVGTSAILTSDLYGNSYFDSIYNRGKTLIDLAHPINNNGRIKTIYVYGKTYGGAKIKICRPHSDGSFTVIHSLSVPQQDSNKMYTVLPLNSRIDCDVLVNKGDCIGIFDMDVYVGKALSGVPDATYTQYNGEASDRFDPGNHYSFGVAGFAIYARGDRWQTNTILDIDLNNRINIEKINIYGSERAEYFEFNIMSCLDVNWSVNLFGESHGHGGMNWWTGDPFFHTHSNLAIGTECLSDMIITPDNGHAGDALQSTAGTHSYFYVTGDAEWLYDFNCDGKHEYCWPNIPNNLVGYDFDPIAFTVIFPNEYTTMIHKCVMYFKERINFRSFGLSYYLGRYDATGNADINTFRYIPSFNKITLDGIAYDSTNNDDMKDYIFKNPCNARPSEANRDSFVSSIEVGWNIIAHEFNAVDASGFRIYCNEHYSTKIMELELYSKFEADPSLSDNLIVTYSDYGDLWSTASFNVITDTEISAFMGGSPRYLRIEIDSSTEFQLNEIELFVGDQFRTEDCEDIILLDDSKRNKVNTSKSFEIENVYDKPFDLYIDLPKEVSGVGTGGLVFWSKLDSIEDIEVPEVGPACILHKADDYPIANDNRQCAINCPSYGLKNLVHDKEAYYNLYDEGWSYFGTLYSGTSIDFSNEGDKDLRVSEFTFDDAPYTSQYWKITTNATTYGAIKSIFVFYNDTPFEVEKIYYFSDPGASSQNYFKIEDGVSISITDFNDDFTGNNGDPPNATLWSVNPPADIYNNRLRLQSSSGDTYGGVSTNYTFDGDFDVQANWYLITYPATNGWYAAMQLDSQTTTWQYRMERLYNSTSFHHYRWEQRNAAGVYTSGGATSTSDTSGIFRFTRVGSTITAYRWLSGAWASFKTWSGSDAVTGPVTFQLFSYSHGTLPSVQTQWDNYVINKGIITTNGFGFKIPANDLVNRIKVFHTNSNLEDVSVYQSSDNTNNYTLVDDNITGNLNIVKNNQIYYQYFAIDLEQRHDLDIIRNYGTATNKIFLSTTNNVDYSNTDLSNVDDVVWNNSTKDDARWVRLKLSCSDGTVKVIRKLGIYPDTGTVFCINGGYNCDWESLGVSLAEYEPIINVAYGASVTGTNTYYGNFYPTNAVDGVFDNYELSATWGFESENEDPFLEVVFDDVYLVDKAVLYHGTNPNDTNYMNTDYNLRLAYSSYYPGSIAIAHGNAYSQDGALHLGDATSYVTVRYVDRLNFGNSDFQINARVKFNSVGTTQYIVHRSMYSETSDTDLFNVQLNGATNKFRVYGRNSSAVSLVDLSSTTVVAPDILYDVAFVRDNGVFRLFVDGVHENSSSSEQYFDNSETTLNVGMDPVSSLYMDGTIEELRFSSIATWTGTETYTPESGNYVWTEGTYILLHFDGEVYMDTFSITGNSSHERVHYFTPTLAHKALLTITGYDSEALYYLNSETGELDIFNGSFLREIEIYTSVGASYVDSETWPVVCVNLQDQFNVLNHALINKDPNDTTTDWDNGDDYFKYSDSIFNDPNKVSFFRAGSEVNIYYSSSSSGDMQGGIEYIFTNNTYIPAGTYSVSCQIYDADYLDEISLRIEGSEVIDIFPTIVADGVWQDVKTIIQIQTDGYYSIKGMQHLDRTYIWGVRYPRIYRTYGLSRWVSVKRDTATNYSWDDDSNKYGLDYLSLVKVYGDTKYKPTEYNWWWKSNLSTLTNDYLTVVGDSRSLKISYPVSSDIDTLILREGDDLGIDVYWSIKDSLGFWLYISDINSFDVSFGDIVFGNGKNYYTWNVENLNLTSGWNHIKLKFENSDSTYPTVEAQYMQPFMDSGLDFRTSGQDMTSFKIRYRGKGVPFTIYLTDLKIERNVFDDDVRFGKGLCLTGYDYLEIPMNGITLEKGTIEFWTKPYYDSYGIDIFGFWNSRTLFTITNNNNNIIALAVKAGNWFELSSGHLRQNCNTFTEQDENVIIRNYISRNDIIHIAISWSNDGNYMSNKDTFRFYINNTLMYISKKTWEVSDTKSALIKLGGGNTQFVSNFETFGGGVFDNVKIYDYCKEVFNIDSEGIERDVSYTANDFTEISSDNINFYGVGSANLPIIFQAVPPGQKRTLYVRSNKNYLFENSTKTANIIASWLTTV